MGNHTIRVKGIISQVCGNNRGYQSFLKTEVLSITHYLDKAPCLVLQFPKRCYR